MATLTREGAKQALCTAILALSGLASGQVLLDEQDMSRPESDHILVTVQLDRRVGRPVRVDDSTVRQNRQMIAQIDAFGEASVGAGAVTALERVHALLFSDDAAMVTARSAGLSIQALEDIRNLTTAFQTGHEPRATLTVTAGYVLELSSTQGGPVATAVVVDLQADTDGDGAIDINVDPLHTTDLT